MTVLQEVLRFQERLLEKQWTIQLEYHPDGYYVSATHAEKEGVETYGETLYDALMDLRGKIGE